MSAPTPPSPPKPSTPPASPTDAAHSLSPAEARAAEQRAKLGLALIALGIAGILWGVFHILHALPTAEKLDFAHRMTDYQARKSVHETFPGGLARSLLGLAVALLGGRIRGTALRALGRLDD